MENSDEILNNCLTVNKCEPPSPEDIKYDAKFYKIYFPLDKKELYGKYHSRLHEENHRLFNASEFRREFHSTEYHSRRNEDYFEEPSSSDHHAPDYLSEFFIAECHRNSSSFEKILVFVFPKKVYPRERNDREHFKKDKRKVDTYQKRCGKSTR